MFIRSLGHVFHSCSTIDSLSLICPTWQWFKAPLPPPPIWIKKIILCAYSEVTDLNQSTRLFFNKFFMDIELTGSQTLLCNPIVSRASQNIFVQHQYFLLNFGEQFCSIGQIGPIRLNNESWDGPLIRQYLNSNKKIK